MCPVTRARSAAVGRVDLGLTRGEEWDLRYVEVRPHTSPRTGWGVWSRQPIPPLTRFLTSYEGQLFTQEGHRQTMQKMRRGIHQDHYQMLLSPDLIRTSNFIPRNQRSWLSFIDHSPNESGANVRFTLSTPSRPEVFVESLDSRIPANTQILVHYGPNYSETDFSKKKPGRPPRKSGRKRTIFSVRKQEQPWYHTQMRKNLVKNHPEAMGAGHPIE